MRRSDTHYTVGAFANRRRSMCTVHWEILKRYWTVRFLESFFFSIRVLISYQSLMYTYYAMCVRQRGLDCRTFSAGRMCMYQNTNNRAKKSKRRRIFSFWFLSLPSSPSFFLLSVEGKINIETSSILRRKGDDDEGKRPSGWKEEEAAAASRPTWSARSLRWKSLFSTTLSSSSSLFGVVCVVPRELHLLWYYSFHTRHYVKTLFFYIFRWARICTLQEPHNLNTLLWRYGYDNGWRSASCDLF